MGERQSTQHEPDIFRMQPVRSRAQAFVALKANVADSQLPRAPRLAALQHSTTDAALEHQRSAGRVSVLAVVAHEVAAVHCSACYEFVQRAGELVFTHTIGTMSSEDEGTICITAPTNLFSGMHVVSMIYGDVSRGSIEVKSLATSPRQSRQSLDRCTE